MHHTQSGKLFSLVNQLFTQPTQKTKLQLGFVTLLLGIVAGSNPAIAQTGTFDRNDLGSSDLSLIAHNFVATPVSGIISNAQMNDVIAGGEHHGSGKKPADTSKGDAPKGSQSNSGITIIDIRPKVEDFKLPNNGQSNGGMPNGGISNSGTPNKIPDAKPDKNNISKVGSNAQMLIMPNIGGGLNGQGNNNEQDNNNRQKW